MNEQEIFVAALHMTSKERALFLDQACQHNVQKRQRVETLLAAHERSASFLNQPAAGELTGNYCHVLEGPGTIIGPYKLLQQIGEGGFGVVFMAEQEKSVRRMVALKIIKPGMDSAQVIARFESERQALALMDHPNIAKVLDAGATSSGRPYFVMELVKGVPITEFCDKNHSLPEARLELFIDICHAIQHAHHKGVIHRDIKPSNVLVTLHDGVPVVKVIDFGVAKAMVQKLTERTLFTAFGQMVGTPAYMSPEQAEMSGLDIDTRSDVYSLGVLLYELLTGTTPLESRRLLEAGYAEMQRLIREEEAPRPSTRLSSLGDSATLLAGNRGLDVKRLTQLLAGDLDWVVMKALEKDRNRRYETVSAFALDVGRFLSEQPIEARPPSTWYRFQLLTRRNKVKIVTAGIVAAALVIGTIISAWQAIRANTAEWLAKSNEGTAQQQKAEADVAKEQAEQRGNELATFNQNLRHSNYVADMNLARVAWEENNLSLARELLDKHRHNGSDKDLRGFEWHYLNRLFHSELLTIKAHNGWVSGVAFMPDGKRIITSGWAQPPKGMKYYDGIPSEIKLWDASTGRPLSLHLNGPIDKVEKAVLSNDGLHLAATCRDNAVVVWNIESGGFVTIERPHELTTSGIDFSADGKRVVVLHEPNDSNFASADRSIWIWEVATQKPVVSIESLPVTTHPAFSADGKRLTAVFVFPGLVKVWDASTGKEQFTCKYVGGYVSRACFSPDSKILAACGEGGIQLWNVATHEPWASWRSDSQYGQNLTFNPDGAMLAAGGMDGIVEVWDAGTGKKTQSFKGHSGNTPFLSFSPDSKRLATGGADGTVRLWDTTGHREVISIPKTGTSQEDVELSPDGQVVLTGCVNNVGRSCQLWDVATAARRGDSIETGRTLLTRDWTADGKHLYFVDTGTNVTVIDIANGKAIRTFPIDFNNGEGVPCTALSADEKLFAHSGPGGLIQVRNAQTGALVRTIEKTDSPFHALVFSLNGRRFAAADRSGRLKIWDTSTWRETTGAEVNDMFIAGIRFSADGKHLVVFGNLALFATGQIRILDAATGRNIWSLAGHTFTVCDVAFSPDGRRLASASADRTVRLWDLSTGQEILKLAGHEQSIGSLRFVSDGQRIISASNDQVIRVWDATPAPE
jgi:eukaryotic-like serine/threonine-protein kinase